MEAQNLNEPHLPTLEQMQQWTEVVGRAQQAGDGAVIHASTLRSARSLYLYFKRHGKASRTNPRLGDLVIWGYGTHVGIYVGNGKAISTLTNGVRVHGVYAVRARFTAYLHTGMSNRLAS